MPFSSHPEFFAAIDKVQVKYEMLRAHVVGGESATAAPRTHGYSRASFYLVAAAFERSGMVGLLDERPGGRGRSSSRRRCSGSWRHATGFGDRCAAAAMFGQ